MTRYIDAEKLKKEMYHEAFETDSDMQKWDSGCWIKYKMFENCIAQQPTADVVKVVRCHNCEYHGIKERCPLLKMFPHRDDERGYCSEGKEME